MLATKLLWVEELVMRGMNHINKEPLNSEERVWAFEFLQPVTNNWHKVVVDVFVILECIHLYILCIVP